VWRVEVAPLARQAIAGLDPGLKAELIERIDEMAVEPAAFLRRTVSPAPRDLWVFDYRSGLIDGLVVSAWFDWWDPHDKRLVMVRVWTEIVG
jgi:hypothetical protein